MKKMRFLFGFAAAAVCLGFAAQAVAAECWVWGPGGYSPKYKQVNVRCGNGAIVQIAPLDRGTRGFLVLSNGQVYKQSIQAAAASCGCPIPR